MKNFKRLLCLCFTFLMAFVLVACGKTENNGDDTKKSESEAVKKASYGSLKAYSIDLSDITGGSQDASVYKKIENGTWAETYDYAIGVAKKETNDEARTAIYHKIEDLLQSTGCIVPLYYYTDIYMVKENVTGFFGVATGAKFFKYTKVGGSTEEIKVCLASEPDTIDPALNSSVDGATIVLHAFSGLVQYDKDGNLVADLAKELPSPTTNEDGSATYVFELRDNIKWSDGTAITADDFIYAWNRAASDTLGADYGYLFEIVKGYGTTEGMAIASLENGTKLSVTLTVDVPYFFELCAFPTFMPVQKAAIEAGGDSWATEPTNYVSSGAYKLTAWTHNSSITLEKNENYWDAANVTMEKITMVLSDDDTAILAQYKTGDLQFIDSVPNNEISTLKATYPNEFVVAGQLGTYYVIFNNNTNLIPTAKCEGMTDIEILHANEEVRNAISMLLDRNYIVEEIGQAGQVPASSFVAMGITNADGTEFYKTAGGNTYAGYFDTSESAYASNCAKAVEVLKKYFDYDESTKKFTNFAIFDYLFNTGTGHQAIGEYIQSALAAYGITVNLSNQEWATFLNTRKDGNFTVARNGWLADYNDPINMLDMWTTASGNNDAQLGK